MLVGIHVQCDEQNECNSNGNSEDGDHHYISVSLTISHMWTRIPQSHTPTLSGIMEVIKRLGNTIIYSLYTSRTITNRNICV